MREDLRPLARRTLTVIGLVFLVGAVLAGVVMLFDALLLAFGGILLAVLLDGLACALARRTRLPRKWTLAVVALALAGLLVGAGWYVGPSVVAQADDLQAALGGGYEALRARVAATDWAQPLAEHLPPLDELDTHAEAVMARLPGLFSTLLGVLTTGLILLFLGLFFAADPELYTEGAVRLAPKAKRERMREVLGSVGRALRKWLMGQFILMAFVGVTTTVGLLVLDVPLALSLGLVGFAFDFVPIIGPLAAAVPAVLIAFVEGPEKALQVALLYLAVQSVESYLLAPLVQKQVVSLPPVMLLLSQVLLGGIAGLVGVTLATPLVVALIVLVQMLYVEDVLGDRDVHVLGEADEEDGGDDPGG